LEEADQLRYFNSRAAEADYLYWCKVPRWTCDEAAALSFTKDPRQISLSDVTNIVKEFDILCWVS
jgi:hypothetical protein